MNRAFPLVAAALAVLVVLAVPAAAQTRTPVRMFVKFTHVDVVDTAPAGDSVGDLTVTAFRVYDRRGGRRIGAGHAYCLRTEVGRANTCTANSSLPGGRIVLSWEEHDGERTTRAAIIGGTGRYRTQRGEIRFTALGPGEIGAGA